MGGIDFPNEEIDCNYVSFNLNESNYFSANVFLTGHVKTRQLGLVTNGMINCRSKQNNKKLPRALTLRKIVRSQKLH